MNIIDIQDQLKNFSEQQLISEMQMPSGSAPQFLVLSEIQRRKRVRDDFTKRQAAQEPTVAQEALAAAGVPMGGIAGMSEAMAPKSSMAQNGIGSVMPQSMRQAVPDTSAQMPMPTDAPIPMAEGGVVRAQQGTYFPSTAELYGLYGQESTFGKDLYGSAGEIGPFQILPTTAIQPGNKIKSLFPELESAIERGDYADAAAAYAANKAMVDEALMSGQRVEPFVLDYLDRAEAILGNRNLALLAYNQGIGGTKGFEGDPTETDYVSGVLGNQGGYEQQSAANNVINMLSQINPLRVDSVEASTLYPDQVQDESEGMSFGQLFNEYILGPKSRELFGTETAEDLAERRAEVVGQRSAEQPGERQRYQQDTQYFYSKEYQDYLRRFGLDPEKVDPNSVPDSIGTFDVLSPREHMEKFTPDSDTGESQADRFTLGMQDDTVSIMESGAEAAQSDATTPEIDEATTTQRETVAPETITDENGKTAPVGTSTTTQGNTVGMPSVQPEKPEKPESKKSESTSLEDEIRDMQAKLEKGREQDKWLAIAQAGLALMSSKEPTLLGAAGEAGVEGLKAFREANERYQEGVVDLINARAKLRGKSDTLKQKDILDANVEILKDPLATVEEKQRARMIVDTMMSGSGYGLVTIPKQAQQ